MKFKIRFADQIVGFFVIFALASLVLVIVMLGRSQRWFKKDVSYTTSLSSASGLSKNMAVQFKGFTIGHVKDFYLTDNDNVNVEFIIFEEYNDRVRLGSMVELVVSPIGLGNQFQFYAGLGDMLLEPGTYVPIVGSVEAKDLIALNFASEPKVEDSITALMDKVNVILDQVSSVTGDLSVALGDGSSDTEIGKMVGSLLTSVSGLEGIPYSVQGLIDDLNTELRPLLASINTITTELNNPDGLIYAVLDTDREVYTGIVSMIGSVSGMLADLERSLNFIPAQLPQIAGLIMDLRETMKTVEEVLVALTNNPLLKRGVPDRLESQDSGLGPRNVRF